MTQPRAILFASLLALVSLQPSQASESFWLKTWTVSTVVNANAHPDLAFLPGKRITLDATNFRDETYEDCTGKVDYSDIHSRPVSSLSQHFGTTWHWPKFPHANVVAGWVRCDGANIGGFAFVDSLHAYRFYEEGAVLQLR